MRPIPAWLVAEPASDNVIGVIRTGKEAQVDLVERRGHDGRTCLIARKRYLPREVTHKGQLEQLGFQAASAFRNDARYREGRVLRKSRDRRAVARRSAYGRQVLHDQWVGYEFEVLERLWHAGAPVPYPIGTTGDEVDLEYLGDRDGAAPQLRAARLGRDDLEAALDQVVAGLRTIVEAGFAHGDLSAYNLLWWAGQVWFIDVPQAVDLSANLCGLDFLHRDVVNICGWFAQRGADVDPEEVFADLLGYL